MAHLKHNIKLKTIKLVLIHFNCYDFRLYVLDYKVTYYRFTKVTRVYILLIIKNLYAILRTFGDIFIHNASIHLLNMFFGCCIFRSRLFYLYITTHITCVCNTVNIISI